MTLWEKICTLPSAVGALHTTIYDFRVNNQITAPELRVIDEEGKNLGVLPFAEAKALAISKGLDLVQIDAMAKPPIAKIVSFDKFRYQREKEMKKQRPKLKELKQVQVSGKAAKNDMLTKIRRIDKFLGDGHKVEIRLRLRGREKANKEWAKEKLQEFLKLIGVEFRVTSELKPTGFGFTMQIDKKA